MEVKLTRKQKKECLFKSVKYSIFTVIIVVVIVLLLSVYGTPKEDPVTFIPWFSMSSFVISLEIFYFKIEEKLIKKIKKEKTIEVLSKQANVRVCPIEFENYDTFFENLKANGRIEFYASLNSENEEVIVLAKLKHEIALPFEYVETENFLDSYKIIEESEETN